MDCEKTDAKNCRFGGKRYLKMKELSDVTGVNGPTIRYYINQGILPKPLKTSRNMAYYDECYVDLINAVKRFQKDYFLPLDVIKNAIVDIGYEKAPFMIDELTRKLTQIQRQSQLPSTDSAHPAKRVTEQELIDVSGIAREDYESSLKNGILVKDDNGTFGNKDVKIAVLISEIRNHLNDGKGFSFDFLTLHNDLIKESVEKQFRFFMVRILNGDITVSEANDLVMTCTELLYRLFPIVHRRHLDLKIKEFLHIG